MDKPQRVEVAPARLTDERIRDLISTHGTYMLPDRDLLALAHEVQERRAAECHEPVVHWDLT